MIAKLAIQHTPIGGKVIDIGVHRGQELFPLADHIGPQGHIWGFEANPDLSKQLEDRVIQEQRTNITIVNKGVYDRTDVLNFYNSPANDALSNTFEPSLVDDHNRRHPHIFRDPNLTVIKLPVVSLDEFFLDQKIDFIKCDAQGAEPRIIQGAQKLIKRSKPAMIYEWEGSVTDQESVEAYNFLTEIGYDLFRITHAGPVAIKKPEDMFCSIYVAFDILCVLTQQER